VLQRKPDLARNRQTSQNKKRLFGVVVLLAVVLSVAYWLLMTENSPLLPLLHGEPGGLHVF